MKNLKDPEKTLDICRENGCFLGLFPHTTDEYHYRWIMDIIRNETGEEIKVPKKKGKKAIPKIIRNGVWNKYVGKEKGCADCLVCGENKIYQSVFTAGHVISEYNGGKIVIENLRPICNTCNLSMGTRNMADFVEEYFPQIWRNYFKISIFLENVFQDFLNNMRVSVNHSHLQLHL